MNGEAGSRNPEAGPAARRLTGLGAFLGVAAAPLERLYWDLFEFSLSRRSAPLTSFGAPPAAFGWYWDSYVLHGALLLLFTLPSLVFAFAAATPRRERALLLAFLPLSGLLSLLAFESAFRIPVARAVLFDVPFRLAWLVPAAGAAGVLGAGFAGIPRPTLAAWARRLLAADLLWIAFLQWNRMGPTARFFPAACLGLGAALLLLGEALARPDPIGPSPPRGTALS